MKIQTKIGFGILPLVLLSITMLGFWAIQTAQEGIEQSAIQHMSTVIDFFVTDKVSELHAVLVKNHLDQEESFVKDYQMHAANSAKELKIQEGSLIFALNENGKLVFCTKNIEPQIIESLWGELSSNIVQSSATPLTGYIHSLPNGYFYAARHFKPWHWVIFYTTSDEEIFSAQNSIRNATVFISGLCAGAALLVLFMVFRKFFVTPVRKIQKAATAIAKGELLTRINVHSKDEMGDLARNMETMSKAIQKHRAEQMAWQEHLETKVNEQTAYLNEKIKERKQIEEALRKSEEKYRSMMEAMNDAAYICSSDFRVEYMNPAMIKRIGRNVIGEVCHKVINNLDERCPFCVHDKIQQGESVEIEIVSPKDNRFYHVTHTPIFYQDGSISKMTIYRDITESKVAEEELQKHRDHLEEMVEKRTNELEDAQEKLIRKEKLAILGQLAGGVSHDLRNPLGVISNAIYYLKLVLNDEDETVQEYLETISSEVERSKIIISDLLDLSRVRPAEREMTEVLKLINQVLKRHDPPKEIEIVTEIPFESPFLFVDAHQIEQVFTNLITNAYQAMPEGGSLNIRARPENGRMSLYITDNGCGISKENMKNIFEPLFTTKARGIGLGLAVSKSLVEVNGGSIDVESEDGKGSTFTVILPTKEVVS